MLYCLLEVIEIQIFNRMESNHFLFMFDETTDSTITEQLAVHGRYIDKETGEFRTHYLKIIDVLGPEIEAVRDSADIDSCISVSAIINRITEFTTEARLDMAKLRGIGTDGAATMTGCCTGVIVRLKEMNPCAIGEHCAAHRLNLASSQAAEKSAM